MLFSINFICDTTALSKVVEFSASYVQNHGVALYSVHQCTQCTPVVYISSPFLLFWLFIFVFRFQILLGFFTDFPFPIGFPLAKILQDVSFFSHVAKKGLHSLDKIAYFCSFASLLSHNKPVCDIS